MSDIKQQQKIEVEIPAGLQELVTIQKDAVYTEKLVEHYRPDFEKALAYELMSGTLAFEPFLAAVKEDVANNEKLAKACRASPGSLIASLLYAAQCKLLPGARYGQLFLIPRNMSRKVGGQWAKIPEVTAMLGYKGICQMMQRSPRVHSVQAHCVYEGEEFDYEPGSDKLYHKWNPKVDRSDDAIVATYAKVVITEREGTHPVLDKPIVWPMTRKQLEAIRARSDAYINAEKSWNGKPPSKDSPYHTDLPAMWRKAPLRAIGSNGAVPLDLGAGGLFARDAESDAPQAELPAPKPTQGSQMRAVLGIDKPVGQFEMVEFATAAIADAKSTTELERLASGWQHFEGAEAEQIALAYEQRLKEIES